jgi:hypothetical protein
VKHIHHSQDTTVNYESLPVVKQPFRPSVFIGHDHQFRIWNPKAHVNLVPDWMAGIILVCFIIQAWNHVFNPGRFLQVIKAPFSKRFINMLVREGNLFNERIAFTLGIQYIGMLALFLYIINEVYLGFQFREMKGFVLYLAILGSIAAFTTIKVALIYILGVIFKTRETTYHYLLNHLIFSMLTGPVLLIFTILMVYVNVPFFHYATIIVVLLIYLIRFFRGFLIGMALTKFSYLLLFVYLCSLEILPLLVVVKVMLNVAKTAVV